MGWDGLTEGVLQCAGALDQLERSLRHEMGRAARPNGASLALLYLDLDDFKAMNDGHDMGDELLPIVAARLRSTLRAGDFVGRLGGDEFACLRANVPGRHELEQVVNKVAQVLSTPVRIGALDLRVRASIGIAVWPGDGDNGDDMLRHADRAMYQAKRQGSGRAFVDRTA